MKMPRFITPNQMVNLRKLIIRTTYEYFNVPEENLYIRSKRPDVVYPRQIVIYLLSEQLHYSQAQIGFLIGGFDRSTVSTSRDIISSRLSVEPKVQNDIKNIKELIKEYESHTA